ncbi:MAG: DMT family transporter [Paracoccaceae bacterium]|nr:DMT family transporter [Paracoccaceae bacterium]
MRAAAASGTLIPSLAIVVGGVFWGLFWLPIRWLSETGLAGGWPGAAILAATLLLLLPMAVLRWNQLRTYWLPLAGCALFTGTAFAFYSISLQLTEVVRCILLFYLTPVWSTALGLALLGERLTFARIAALLLGAAGLLVVLGFGAQFPWPRNIGDWLALGSGLAWAYGSLKLYRMGAVAVPEQILTFIIGSLVVALAAIAIGGPAFGGTPDGAALRAAAPYALLAALYVLPMVWLTLWPTTLLSPGRVGILLMSEVVVGVASAATLSGEPFGAREALGAALIIGAGLVEVLGQGAVVE